MKKEEIYFVYNADTGVWNAMFDTVHKLFSPRTYNCKLCSLTHGVVGEKGLWSAFKSNVGRDFVLLHKYEWQALDFYKPELLLPTVFIKDKGEVRVLISAEDFTQIQDLPQFLELLKLKLSAY